ncbi:hypothetical protein [Constantimarinum furrinae]|uniref:Lysylphosphatidylglycerol synthase TM region n=1 Tax=Constantimarinum furrinae TaxID=2562285 RepID=A0A7G8PS58_9FLAO|nr:hypothetical protein [Constantimarinum furrinae]QNJ97174.1 hypothetical protein ALE3EI_0596 [Constantimarinum furrinae]
MISLSHKAKQYLTTAVKVFILAVTFMYIYQKLSGDETINASDFFAVILSKSLISFPSLFIILLLALANWTFEILKWKTVAAVVEPISLKTAAKQSLASLTVSLPTPNRIGDYGAKALFFEASHRKKIMTLNFFSNGAQMLITLILGIVGLCLLISRFEISIAPFKLFLFCLVILILGIAGYFFKEKELLIKGLSISKVTRYIKNLPLEVKLKVVLFSFCRYLIFSYMFLKVMRFFEADIAMSQAIPLLFSMYLLVSVVPSFFIFDVIVRGGVAVWLFSLLNIPDLTVLSTVMVMWILNFAVPAILGSFYVVTYKPTST